MNAKYIRCEYGFAIFSPENTHHNMARAAREGSGEPISAGFIGMRDDGSIYCYGKSQSLKLEAIAGDEEYIETQLNK